jgi:uridine phosphorylase
LKSFFDPSDAVLNPRDIVCAFTKKGPDRLALPGRALIVFAPGDLAGLVRDLRLSPVADWRPFRQLYVTGGGGTVVTRSHFGGPAIAALVEELAAFGVQEFCLWGYCGAIGPDLAIGDCLVAVAALREDGISYHYLHDEDDVIGSEWAPAWVSQAQASGFRSGVIWSSDAIYRETTDKIRAYAGRGMLGVEMETASFYAVCRQRGLRGVAFLVVSDLLTPERWTGGFGSGPLKAGARNMADFLKTYVTT